MQLLEVEELCVVSEKGDWCPAKLPPVTIMRHPTGHLSLSYKLINHLSA